jgi:predicted lipoprotein with Yx(FWY)xxD motif
MRNLTLAAFAAALLVSAVACGEAATTAGSNTSSSSTSSSMVEPTVPDPAAVTVKVAPSPYGKILVDGTGRTLYAYLLDSVPKFACVGECLAHWVPVMVAGNPTLKGVNNAIVDTAKREGEPQLVIGGQPVYTFVGDETAGEYNGQGVDSLWFMIKPTGLRNTVTEI